MAQHRRPYATAQMPTSGPERWSLQRVDRAVLRFVIDPPLIVEVGMTGVPRREPAQCNLVRLPTHTFGCDGPLPVKNRNALGVDVGRRLFAKTGEQELRQVIHVPIVTLGR